MFGIISLISNLVWIFSERDLFLVTGTDTSSVLYIFVSVQYLSKSRSMSAYCACFIALLESPYAVLFRIGLCFWVRFTFHLHQHSA